MLTVFFQLNTRNCCSMKGQERSDRPWFRGVSCHDAAWPWAETKEPVVHGGHLLRDG